MKTLAVIDLLSIAPDWVTEFRGSDRYSISDRRTCLKILSPETVEFPFELGREDVVPGTGEVVMEGCLDLHADHAYVWKHINSVLEVAVNGRTVFDGVQHWRSHEETVAFWNPFDFPFDMSLLRAGVNTVRITNKTSRRTLGEFFDPQLLDQFDEDTAVRKLATLYLAALTINFRAGPKVYPCLAGVPRCAVAGVPFIVEVSTGPRKGEVAVTGCENADVRPLGIELEMNEYRALFEVTPLRPGSPCTTRLRTGGTEIDARVDVVYAPLDGEELIVAPGAESTYWRNLNVAAQDCFAEETGNGFRFMIDDYLADLHFVSLSQWIPFISYLVRRRKRFAIGRHRVPPYSKTPHVEVGALAGLGGDLFAGAAVIEPVSHLDRDTGTEDLAERLASYLEYFRSQMESARIGGGKVVTFDSAGPMCGHYYPLGLDVHLAELGPACNCVEEACCRGAAQAFEKPWGVAVAMHWYCGQGAQYAYDDARVRFAWLTMLSSYLAGARQIMWEGGCFENLPVYNGILSEESWRDYGRRYDAPELKAMRSQFGGLLNFHRAQQFPSPVVRHAIIHGTNDLFHGEFRANTTRLGDMSTTRAWLLLKVFLPHFSFGRQSTDHGRSVRRWYSATPYGQVDVAPAHAGLATFEKYQLLALAGWNTMTEELHEKLLGYVRGGGTLFVSLPHFTTDTAQQHVWRFFRGGDLSELCGLRARELGPRLERVIFETDMFAAHLPREFVLSPRAPLFVHDLDEPYPVFSFDVTYFSGEVEVLDAEVLARSQAGQPVILRRKIGDGWVYLLNSYHHCGRGRLLDLAEGVLRTLVEAQQRPIRVSDERGVVSWFEYERNEWTEIAFLNTDWTTAGNEAPVVVNMGEDEIRFAVPEGRPVRVLTDGARHVIVTDPAMQVSEWQSGTERLALTTFGGGRGGVYSPQPHLSVTLNGTPLG